MKNLNQYKRKFQKKMDSTQTTVNLETKQKEFIDLNELNLSEITRDAINALMVEDAIRKGKTK